MKPRVPGSKTMRVATVLTGMTACAAAVAPPVTAHAATQAGHTAPPALKIADLGHAGKGRLRVRVPGQTVHAAAPDGSVPNLDFSLGITIGPGVSKFHVCGYHPGGVWRCTKEYTGFNKNSPDWVWQLGGNIRSWQRGQTDVYWNNGGKGSWDTCNTNGAYLGATGYWSPDLNTFDLSPNYVWLSDVGPGQPEC
jgi:hypothetical protein